MLLDLLYEAINKHIPRLSLTTINSSIKLPLTKLISLKYVKSIEPHRLLRVLTFYNTPQNLVKWIEDFHSEHKQVTVNGVFLKWHAIISDMRYLLHT